MEDSLRTIFKIQRTPLVSCVFCMLSPFEKNAIGWRSSVQSLGGGDKGLHAVTAVCSLPHPALALLAWGLHSLLSQFLFCSVFWQWNVIYKCSYFTTSLSHPRAELLCCARFPPLTPEGTAASLLLQHGSWCRTPYEWPDEFPCFDIDKFSFMLFSLLVCFLLQPHELCWQEQDENGKDAGEGQECLF